MDEEIEIILLKFWLEKIENIGEIPEQLKSKVSEDDLVMLLATLPKDDLVKGIQNRLEVLQNKTFKKEEIEALKKPYSLRTMWKTYLLFGALIVIVNTVISFKVNEFLQGPACRIDTTTNVFYWNKSTEFNLSFLIINLRNQKVIFNKAEVYCYWPSTQKQINLTEELPEKIIPVLPPEATQTPIFIDELGALPLKQYGCKSPNSTGEYTISIKVLLNSETCSKDIIMNVK